MLLCSLAIDGVGFNATVKTTSIPSVMPPRIPPQLFVKVTTLPFSSYAKASLFSLPLIAAEAKPAPNSIPLTAGMAKTSSAILPSAPSKRGPPSPHGTPPALHLTSPPTESPSAFAASTVSANLSVRPPIATISEVTVMPLFSRICSAMPPAAQSGAVILPEKLPPPR